jgi:hypothetical protein
MQSMWEGALTVLRAPLVDRTLPAETSETCRCCEAELGRAAVREDEPAAAAAEDEDGADARPTADRNDLRRNDIGGESWVGKRGRGVRCRVGSRGGPG